MCTGSQLTKSILNKTVTQLSEIQLNGEGGRGGPRDPQKTCAGSRSRGQKSTESQIRISNIASGCEKSEILDLSLT
jgi:hypothetical protein